MAISVQAERVKKKQSANDQSLWQRIMKSRQAYLMLLPLLIGFCVFTLYPNLWVITLSFFQYNGVSAPKFTGLENYIRLFTRDTEWWQAVLNTMVFTFGKLLIEIPLALLCAVLLNSKLRGNSFLKGVLFLPNVISLAIMCTVFVILSQPVTGLFNDLLFKLGAIKSPAFDFLGTMPSAMLTCMAVSIWQNYGLNMLLFVAGLQGIPSEIYESGDLDGAVGFKRFWYITLPMLARMFQLIMMLAIIGSLQIFDLMWLLTAGGPSGGTEVMMTHIFKYYFPPSAAQSAIPQMGYGSALGVTASIIIGIVTVIFLLVSRKMDEVV